MARRRMPAVQGFRHLARRDTVERSPAIASAIVSSARIAAQSKPGKFPQPFRHGHGARTKLPILIALCQRDVSASPRDTT